jgi:hypothetical protein
MAWSDWARRKKTPLFPQCVGIHQNCANRLRWAPHWQQFVLTAARGTRHTVQLPPLTELEAA